MRDAKGTAEGLVGNRKPTGLLGLSSYLYDHPGLSGLLCPPSPERKHGTRLPRKNHPVTLCFDLSHLSELPCESQLLPKAFPDQSWAQFKAHILKDFQEPVRSNSSPRLQHLCWCFREAHTGRPGMLGAAPADEGEGVPRLSF